MHNHRLSLSKTASRWLLLLMALLMLLVTAQPAQAEKYTFSGGLLPILGNNLPPGCEPNSFLFGFIIGNTYNCGALTLADSDTVTIIGGPITINFSAIFNTGAAQINVGGKADNVSTLKSRVN